MSAFHGGERTLIGRSLGHYAVVSAIGAGGMGEVYRAHDTRLGRDVALKVLPARMAADPDRLERFRREARAVAALNHPHIVTIHSVEEADGVHFLTMELVEGRSLERLVPDGGLPLDRILAIAGPLADALAYAHERGIVHRDLKPANVMVTSDGRVKVLDFGLAKVLSVAQGRGPASDATFTAAGRTAVGVVMGTPAYMSPEQVAGRPVDHRTDLFSLGVLLYEMASGRRPFEGASSAELASAILRDAPRPLGELRADLPADLTRIIRRCLEKDPALRIQTARDVLNELRSLAGSPPAGQAAPDLGRASASAGAWAAAGAPARAATSDTPGAGRPATLDAASISGFGGRPAIAVLPFDNLSRDPEQEYFADGLAEDLITRLSLWRSFPVIARNSSFAYRGGTADVKKVATELNVRYVVLGSVRKAGNRVRISAQLVDATTGQQVWARSYDRDLTDVFALQDEISEAIAAPLVSDMDRAESAKVQRHAPEDLQAWELYQRALPLLVSFERDDFAQARMLLERATEIDSHFALALARLAEVRLWQVLFAWTDEPDETVQLALGLARRAVAIDPADAMARLDLAFALITAGDAFGALEESRRSVELNPSLPFALSFHGYLLTMTGHPPDESIALAQRAMRLSPRDPAQWQFFDTLGPSYFMAARYSEGLEASRRLIALTPSYYWGHLWGAINAVGLGQFDDARELVRQARALLPGLSIAHVRSALGAMAPEVDRRICDALREAGVE